MRPYLCMMLSLVGGFFLQQTEFSQNTECFKCCGMSITTSSTRQFFGCSYETCVWKQCANSPVCSGITCGGTYSQNTDECLGYPLKCPADYDPGLGACRTGCSISY